MSHFIDEVRLVLSSGAGGQGCVSFRREKYIARGGPDGGDGGDGGDIIIKVQRNLKTLTHLRRNGHYKAGHGQPGRGSGKHGSNGRPVVLVVPPGTVIKDTDTGEVLLDLLLDGQEITFLKGGKGGRGNIHFATSRNQAPRYAQPGLPGHNRSLTLELSLIADIGFVGFPNAGKSTLLKALTAANPKIGDYPFTTKIPNLGVMNWHGTDLILADIPGIIAGASRGAGLGLRFLKHLSRVAGLAVLIDLSDDVDHLQQLAVLSAELVEYGHGLETLPRVIVGSKLDLPLAAERFAALQTALPTERLVGISALGRLGLAELQAAFWQLYRQAQPAELSPDSEPTVHPYDWEGADTLSQTAQTRYNIKLDDV